MMKKPITGTRAPRNPFVSPSHNRKAGAHRARGGA
jgi:hypothetical protein